MFERVMICDAQGTYGDKQAIKREKELFRRMIASRVDGIIFVSSVSTENREKYFSQIKKQANKYKNIPLVSIERDLTSVGIDSVYFDGYANARMARYLEEYLQENPVDAIVMPHLYPAETITYMRRNGFALPLTVAVMTDYTCIPFWEETDCDYYITPHKKLHPEIIKRGIPAYKLKAFGIPVSRQCREDISREQARDMLGLEQEKKYFLLAAGSMGTKAIVHILELLLAMRSKKENLVVICGSNQKLKKKLQQKYKNRKEVRLVGYTKKMPLYLKACDVIFTKPGGLTSTEAAVSGIPIVHIRPIPGCETENRRFFRMLGR